MSVDQGSTDDAAPKAESPSEVDTEDEELDEEELKLKRMAELDQEILEMDLNSEILANLKATYEKRRCVEDVEDAVKLLKAMQRQDDNIEYRAVPHVKQKKEYISEEVETRSRRPPKEEKQRKKKKSKDKKSSVFYIDDVQPAVAMKKKARHRKSNADRGRDGRKQKHNKSAESDRKPNRSRRKRSKKR